MGFTLGVTLIFYRFEKVDFSSRYSDFCPSEPEKWVIYNFIHFLEITHLKVAKRCETLGKPLETNSYVILQCFDVLYVEKYFVDTKL